ncbi:LysE family translocator [Pseudonocardia acaciae]|uniref:LysE family translocator n=1 Tax=Pseudonocardia acaciae TaxID=551276 RepID=UPI000490A9A2|nr:LysE family translocator [Pseudonocardia acaciae]
MLPGFLAAVLVIAIAPGPDMAYIVAVAADRGRRAGVVSAAGMALGMAVHVTAAALGLAALVSSASWALDVIRLAGAGYLGWLAVDTLRSARRAGLTARTPPASRRILRRAVLTNLANPKIILFFAAFLPSFVRPGHGPVTGQLLTLGLLFLLVGLAVDSVIGLAAGRLAATLAPGGAAATVVSVGAGVVFGGLAAVLLADVLAG